MKKWQQPPTKKEVEQELRAFFELLKAGELDLARAAVGHHSDDWESQIWSIWQDTYLIYLEEQDQEVEDDSFEGKAWLSDLSWLQELGFDGLKWDEAGERVNPEGEQLSFYLTYQGEPCDASGEFEVVKDDSGYHLSRRIIHLA